MYNRITTEKVKIKDKEDKGNRPLPAKKLSCDRGPVSNRPSSYGKTKGLAKWPAPSEFVRQIVLLIRLPFFFFLLCRLTFNAKCGHGPCFKPLDIDLAAAGFANAVRAAVDA